MFILNSLKLLSVHSLFPFSTYSLELPILKAKTDSVNKMNATSLMNQLALAVGALILLRLVFRATMSFYRHFLRPARNLKKVYGSWACVTGATDGIGKAIATELARRYKMNVLLISRTQSKLDAVAEEISKYGVETQTLSVDYSNFNEKAQENVKDLFDSLDLGVLINNVGVSYDHPMYFHELSDDAVSKLIALNIQSTTVMTRIALPSMIQRAKGAIVNIGSAAGLTESPLLAQYSAAKSYIEKFSTSLHAEYAPKGIHVSCQAPFFIVSKLSKFRRPSLFVPSAVRYAKLSVDAIGYEAVSSPYWLHDLVSYFFECVDGTYRGSALLSHHLSIRKRALRKKERLAKETKTD